MPANMTSMIAVFVDLRPHVDSKHELNRVVRTPKIFEETELTVEDEVGEY